MAKKGDSQMAIDEAHPECLLQIVKHDFGIGK